MIQSMRRLMMYITRPSEQNFIISITRIRAGSGNSLQPTQSTSQPTESKTFTILHCFGKRVFATQEIGYFNVKIK